VVYAISAIFVNNQNFGVPNVTKDYAETAQNITVYLKHPETIKNVDVALAVRVRIRVMVFNATFNNSSSVISWRSVVLVEETGVPGEIDIISGS
jgi:hypothetical protein